MSVRLRAAARAAICAAALAGCGAYDAAPPPTARHAVLVSLDALPEVRITGNLPDFPIDQIRIGMRVRATWNEFEGNDGVTYRLPQWGSA